MWQRLVTAASADDYRAPQPPRSPPSLSHPHHHRHPLLASLSPHAHLTLHLTLDLTLTSPSSLPSHSCLTYRYVVDLGKDPTFARRKLTELRTESFLSSHTRRATLSMTVYNNALPMFCFVRLVFDISPTGQFKSKFVIEVRGRRGRQRVAGMRAGDAHSWRESAVSVDSLSLSLFFFFFFFFSLMHALSSLSRTLPPLPLNSLSRTFPPSLWAHINSHIPALAPSCSNPCVPRA